MLILVNGEPQIGLLANKRPILKKCDKRDEILVQVMGVSTNPPPPRGEVDKCYENPELIYLLDRVLVFMSSYPLQMLISLPFPLVDI